MGEALFELEQILRSKQNSLTFGEANLLQTCKSKAIREFTLGALIGGGFTWAGLAFGKFSSSGSCRLFYSLIIPLITPLHALAGAWRLNKFVRLNISGGAAALSGLWRFGRSLDSCIDHILSLDGSRMQKELANIVATKYQDDPRTMQRISKHFYYEKVFDDSTMDKPKLRWRYRNFFSDGVDDGQLTHENEPHKNLHGNSHHGSPNSDSNISQSDSYDGPDRRGKEFEFKQIPTMPGTDTTIEPLDCIFGPLATKEDIQHPDASSPSPKSRARSRRYHRRHRRHDQTSSTSFEHT